MKKYEELFYLIKALTPGEKRNFKLYASKYSGKSNHIKLFEAIDAQDTYEEALIKAKFKEEKFIEQLHVTKNYLRRMILQSMRSAETKRSHTMRVRDILGNVEIFYTRMLHKHCMDEINRAEKICRKYELDPALLEVLNWKRKLVQAKSPGHIDPIHQVIEEESAIINRMVNTIQHRQLMVEISRSGLGGEVSEKSKKSKLLASEKNAFSFQARVQYYHSLYHIAIMSGDDEKAESTMKELLNFMDSNPEKLAVDPGLYIASVNNFIAYFVFQKKTENALELISVIHSRFQRAGIDKSNLSLFRQVLRTYNLELEIIRDQEKSVPGSQVLSEVERVLIDKPASIPDDYRIIFYFQLSSIYFNRKDYSGSLKWINAHLNSEIRQIRPDLQAYIRILNLMIHLELNNLFVLGYYIDNTRRYLVKMKSMEPWMRVLLRFFSRMRNATAVDIPKEFNTLRESLFPEGSEPLITNEILDYIDFRKWIDHRLNPKAV